MPKDSDRRRINLKIFDCLKSVLAHEQQPPFAPFVLRAGSSHDVLVVGTKYGIGRRIERGKFGPYG